MESIRALLGESNLQSAFWFVTGSVVLSNIGLVIGALISRIKKESKFEIDLNVAFKRIKRIEKHIKLDSLDESEN